MRRPVMPDRRLVALVVVALAASVGRSQDPPAASEAGPDAGIAATRSLIVGPSGPRKGEKPALYFNVQGPASRGDGRFSSFGVLDFPRDAVMGAAGAGGAGVPGLSLVLTQSIPPFARKGRVTVWLAADSGSDEGQLRFAAGEDGPLGEAGTSAFRCGTCDFAVGETGQEDRIPLSIPEERWRAITEGPEEGTLRLFILPDDPGVAATWFGTDQPRGARHPRLVVD